MLSILGSLFVSGVLLFSGVLGKMFVAYPSEFELFRVLDLENNDRTRDVRLLYLVLDSRRRKSVRKPFVSW